MRKLSLTLLLLISAVVCGHAQATQMADELRSNGKIYVVVAVLATIFAGILIYLVMLDRKITRLEKHRK